MIPAAADFGAPIYQEDEPTSGHDEQETSDGSDVSVVDLNDPGLLLQEITGFDPNADPYASPPPIPDGFYRAKLKQIDVKKELNPGKGEMVQIDQRREMDYPGGGAPGVPVFLPNGEPKMYIATAIEATVIDPGGKYDNIKVYDRFFDSRVDRYGSVKMLHLLRVLGHKIPSPLHGKTLGDAIKKALAGEPEVDIKTEWEGQASQDDTAAIKEKKARAPRIKGMQKYPQAEGKYLPDMQVTVAGFGKVNVHAQAQLAGIFPVGTKTKKK